MMTTTARTTQRLRTLLAAPLLPLAIALALACGDEASDGDGTPSPTATAEGTPTAGASPTPAQGTTTPTRGEPTATPAPTPTPSPEVDITPVEPFEVRSVEAINVRDEPSTSGVLLTTLFPGETATVTGQAQGEAVEPGDTTWYRIQITRDELTTAGFLYAAYVVEVP